MAKTFIDSCLEYRKSLVFELAKEMKQNLEQSYLDDGLFFYTFALEDELPHRHMDEGEITGEILNTGEEFDPEDRVFLRGFHQVSNRRRAS